MALTSFFGAAFFNGEFFLGAAEAVVTEQPAGRRRRPPVIYRLRVGNRKLAFDDVDTLIAFLNEEQRRQEARAEARAVRDARRIERIGAAEARPRPPLVRITTQQPEIRDYVRQLQERIDRIYWDALSKEAIEEEEEIVILASSL